MCKCSITAPCLPKFICFISLQRVLVPVGQDCFFKCLNNHYIDRACLIVISLKGSTKHHDLLSCWGWEQEIHYGAESLSLPFDVSSWKHTWPFENNVSSILDQFRLRCFKGTSDMQERFEELKSVISKQEVERTRPTDSGSGAERTSSDL